MASKKVETLPAFPKVHDLRLVRMQLQPQPGQDLPRRVQSHLRLVSRPAQDHEVVGIPHQHSDSPALEFPVEGVQVDVGEQGRDHPAL